MIFIGAMLAAASLEVFLVPNQIIDGGVVGISIMLSYITGWPLGMYVVVLNLPFLYLGYKHIGRSFALSTLCAVLFLSYWLAVFRPMSRVTDDLFLAAVFGGIIIGLGVGLIIRYGGSLDGTEIVAILIDRRSGFSIGEIILVFNVVILAAAGLHRMGWMRHIAEYLEPERMCPAPGQGALAVETRD
ncbi:MAG: YitT family protein, partial [Negativicutes bacterium]|nr:YitT family protein [Negativicutes bacterium]